MFPMCPTNGDSEGLRNSVNVPCSAVITIVGPRSLWVNVIFSGKGGLYGPILGCTCDTVSKPGQVQINA